MKSIQQKIKDKGVTKSHVAKMVGIDLSTLSRIVSGKQSHVSEGVLAKINTYLDQLNSDQIKIV